MAGGSGERFWPVSRRARPKQLLALTDSGKTMIAEAIERIAPLIPEGDIFIITNELLLAPTRAALPGFPPENIIAEPAKRNTAPCLALAAAFIAARYAPVSEENISIAVLTADHAIAPAAAFRETIDAALCHAEQTGSLVTIGIVPTRPETGYGYVEIASETAANAPADVVRFCEKPDAATARRFVESGKYYWNSGMFFWRLDAFIREISAAMPLYSEKITELTQAYSLSNRQPMNGSEPLARECFAGFSDISIDYGLMERSPNVSVVPAGFSWDDVGSWDALDRLRSPGADGNIIAGNVAGVDNSRSIILNESERAVAVIGAENLAVIVTDDAVLVCPKDRVQEVKKAVALLREAGGERFL